MIASAVVIVNITIPYDITAIPSGFPGYNGIEIIPEYCPTDKIDKEFDINIKFTMMSDQKYGLRSAFVSNSTYFVKRNIIITAAMERELVDELKISLANSGSSNGRIRPYLSHTRVTVMI